MINLADSLIMMYMKSNVLLKNMILQQEVEEIQHLLSTILEEFDTIEKDLTRLAKNRSFVREITTIKDEM